MTILSADNDIRISLRLPQLRILEQRQRDGLIEVEVMYRRPHAVCPSCGYHTAAYMTAVGRTSWISRYTHRP